MNRLYLFSALSLSLCISHPTFATTVASNLSELSNSHGLHSISEDQFKIATNDQPLSFIPDLSLIRKYSKDLQSLAPYPPPYYTYFHKGKKELYYVAASHEPGPDNGTFKAIRLIFQKAKPDIVVIEGLATEQGLSPTSYQENAKHAASQNFKFSVEPEYLAYQAMQANVPFVGAEPTDKIVFEQLLQNGHSEIDIVGLYMMRNIHFWVSEEKINAQTFDEKASFYLEHLRYYRENNIPLEKRLTLQQIKEWFQKHNSNSKKTLLEITAEDVAPLSTPDATYFQKISAAVDEIRERNVDTEIARLISNYDRVLVVYGSAHLLKSRKVIEKMLGPGKDFLP